MNTNKYEKKEAVKKVLPMFKVKSGVKSGFSYTIGGSFDKAAEFLGNVNDTVQSKISSVTS